MEQQHLIIPIGVALSGIERQVIVMTLHKYQGNRTKTAKALGIGVRTVQRKLRSYGLSDFLKDKPTQEGDKVCNTSA